MPKAEHRSTRSAHPESPDTDQHRTSAVIAGLATAPTIAALTQAYPSLPRSERRVADFILSHATEVPHLTSTELGRRAGVSQSIVSRLCLRVFDGGYGALRLGLAQELAVAEASDHTHESGHPGSDLDGDDILRHTTEDLAVAARAIAVLDRDRLRLVARMLCDARSIVICGMSLSGAMGQRLAHLLHLEGLPARAEREPYNPPYWSLGLGEDSVLMAISYRGDAPDLSGLVEHGKHEGAELLVITNETRSRLARSADLVINTHAPSVHSDEDWASSAALYVQLATVRAVWFAVRAELADRKARAH